jgi:hypothetical protein
VGVAVPLALVLGASAWRVHWHTGKWGLVSTNGPLNFTFGRCHATGIHARARDGRGFFGPPALGMLHAYGREHKDALFKLDPALGASITFEGHMVDAEPLYTVSRLCVKRTGSFRQVKYAITHVVLLWGYNTIWPDGGKFRIPMAIAGVAHTALLLPPAALAMFLAFRRRRARTMLLALHVWALVAMAMLYFGDTRYRAPYDGVIIVLAIDTYVIAFRGVRTGIRWLRAKARGVWGRLRPHRE